MQKNVASQSSALGNLLPQMCALLLIPHSTELLTLEPGIPQQFYGLAIEMTSHFPSQRAGNCLPSGTVLGDLSLLNNP